MSWRYVSPALFVVAALLGLMAALDRIGFYGGMAAFGCFVLGVIALPMRRDGSRRHGPES